MILTIDTEKLSALDRTMLKYLAGDEEPTTAPAPAKQAAPAKAAAPAKKAAPAPEPEPEPEEDLLGGPTVSDAIAAATRLVSDNQSARVKEALAVVQVKKVSDLTADNVAAFLAALEAE